MAVMGPMAGRDDAHEDPVANREVPAGRTVVLRDLPDRLAAAGTAGDLQRVEPILGHLPGDRCVRLSRNRDFRQVRSGYLVPRETDG